MSPAKVPPESVCPATDALNLSRFPLTSNWMKNSAANASYDEEIETFSGDSIDLTSSVIRNILAVLPMKVVCRDDCKGLCPVCGQNLNIKDCGCDTTYIDPRFESLRSLLKFDEEV